MSGDNGTTRRAAIAGGAAALALASTTQADDSRVEPFTYRASDDALADLRRRLAQTRWPQGEVTKDWSQGVPSHRIRALIDHWTSKYDWRRIESRLNSFPQFRTEIDG